MSGRLVGASVRAYHALIRLYPRRFREEYGTDAVEAFSDRCREAVRGGGALGLLVLWARTLPNVLAHGLLERWADARAHGLTDQGGALVGAARGLVRSPALGAFVVGTLALGIGSNVALFSVLKGVLLEPLPYPEAERLVRLWETNRQVDDELHGPSPLNFADWERAATPFESMAAWYLTSGTYRTDRWVEEIRSAQVTVDFFRVLGVAPMLGSDFRRDRVVRYGPVMLSHRVWLRLFGGDPGVVGRTIVSSGQTYEIVGVMPPGFAFPDESVETWIAWNLDNVYADRPESRTWRFLDGIGRLAPGASPQEAEASLDGAAAGLARAYPIMDGGWDAAVTSLHEEIVGDVRGTLWLAFGAVLSILLIACANVASLLLARVPARSRDLAIRTTLGATRGRIARELFAENVLLATAAGLLGLVVGRVLLALLVSLDAGRIPRLAEVRIDGGVFAFTAVLACATGILFGLAPALHALGASLRGSLGDGARRTAGRGHRRLREAFVTAQVAVAVVLLTFAGLFARSLREVRRVDPGLDAHDVATFRLSLDPVDGTEEEIVRYYDGLLERLAEVPGVVRVGAAQTLPLNPVGNDFRRPYRHVGSTVEAALAPAVQMRITTPGYVDAIGMRLVEGERLPPQAGLGEPLVALVNETLAARLWPGGSAVGETFEIDFRQGWEPYRVVGVVHDVKHYGPRSETMPEVFLSHRQVPYLAMSVVVRTEGDPARMTEALRAAVLAHAPMQPPHGFVTLDELLSRSTAEERFLAVLLGVFAAIALLLASTGVYGVIAYSVSHRRGEIGVRLALGARPARVLWAVLARALAMAGVGLAIGVALVAALSRGIASLLFGITPSDPSTNLATVALLLAVSIVAAYVPARRAAGVPPSDALRSE